MAGGLIMFQPPQAFESLLQKALSYIAYKWHAGIMTELNPVACAPRWARSKLLAPRGVGPGSPKLLDFINIRTINIRPSGAR